MDNVTNNGYTRCADCQMVYESDKNSCPRCGRLNTYKIEETEHISEGFEPVFNIND